MIVKKFGGSSLQDAEHILKVCNLIREDLLKHEIVVVLSAMKGVTDSLEQAATAFSSAFSSDASSETFLETSLDAPSSQYNQDNRDKNKEENKSSQDKDDTHSYQPYYDFIVDVHCRAWKEICTIMGQHVDIPQELLQLFEQLKEVLLGISLIKECTAQSLDLVMSFGERLSATLFVHCYNLGTHSQSSEPDAQYTTTAIPSTATYIDARTCIITEVHKNSVRFSESYEQIRTAVQQAKGLPVITGFIASKHNGVTTTLGRNGSDYTASLVGVALSVSRIEIWTDVDGILSADPRIVPEAFVVPRISYSEAMELSYFGAKVMYPVSFVPATEHAIPIVIKNTTNPGSEGTWIVSESQVIEDTITGIALLRGVSLITIEGAGLYGNFHYLPKIFEILSTHHTRPIMISQASSEHSICLALMAPEAEQTVHHLRTYFKTELAQKSIQSVQLLNDISIISVIGSRMKGYVGIAGKIFNVIGSQRINIIAIAQGSSELNISFAVEAVRDQEAVQYLHQEFFSERSNRT